MKNEKLKSEDRRIEIEKSKNQKMKNENRKPFLRNTLPQKKRERERERERESSTKRESFRRRRFRRLLFDLVKSTLSSEDFLVIASKGGGFDHFFARSARPRFLNFFAQKREREPLSRFSFFLFFVSGILGIFTILNIT